MVPVRDGIFHRNHSDKASHFTWKRTAADAGAGQFEIVAGERMHDLREFVTDADRKTVSDHQHFEVFGGQQTDPGPEDQTRQAADCFSFFSPAFGSAGIIYLVFRRKKIENMGWDH